MGLVFCYLYNGGETRDHSTLFSSPSKKGKFTVSKSSPLSYVLLYSIAVHGYNFDLLYLQIKNYKFSKDRSDILNVELNALIIIRKRFHEIYFIYKLNK